VPEEKKIVQKEKRKNLQSNSNFLISNHHSILLIQAEISIYPMATRTTSASFYIAKAIESIQNIENLRFEINSMGTILESDSIDVINAASKKMMETVHNLGIVRVEVIIKIDSRRDKDVKMEEKIASVKKYIGL
jgi:uncharacterized protein (TIGR00106 family)